jgi:broad specificity phosphatase PhoE
VSVELVFETHSWSTHNEAGLASGWLDGRLAEYGRPYPEGESYLHVVARVREFLDELARTHDGERVLVIGHAATRWSLDHLLDGAALEDLVEAPFDWREGWFYVVPDGWGTPAR